MLALCSIESACIAYHTTTCMACRTPDAWLERKDRNCLLAHNLWKKINLLCFVADSHPFNQLQTLNILKESLFPKSGHSLLFLNVSNDSPKTSFYNIIMTKTLTIKIHLTLESQLNIKFTFLFLEL